MNTIVVISEQQNDFTMFSSNFSHLPIHFSWNKNMQVAMEKLSLEQPFILFTVSRNMEQLLDWLRTYDASKFQIPLVAFTSTLNWSDREVLWKTGVSDIVELPRSRKELEYIIRAFLLHPQVMEVDTTNHMQGQLKDLGVIDLIRSFSPGKKNGILILEKDSAKGQLEFHRGKLVNATLAECDPLEAVLVMSLWKEGRFYGKFDQEKHKERILLDNEQVIIECANYQNAYQKSLQKLPDWKEMLYTDPDLEYQEFGPKDREILQRFRDGLTIYNFMSGYEGNWNFILKKFILWLDRKWLLREDDYELLQAKIKAEERKSPFRKAIDKMFSKNESDLSETEMLLDSTENDSIEFSGSKIPTLFNQNHRLLQFSEALKGTLEAAIIIADSREDELLFGSEDMQALEGCKDVSFTETFYSEQKSVIFYRFREVERNQSWSVCEHIFSKIPFLLVLFQRENGQLVSLIKQIEQRFEIPVFFVTSQMVENENQAELQAIPENRLLFYDSLAQEKLQNVFNSALDLYLNRQF